MAELKEKKQRSGKPFWKREGFQGYLFMGPTLIGFPLLCAYPMIYSLYCAFCDWDGYNNPVFTGLKNFRYILMTDPVFPKTVKITLISGHRNSMSITRMNRGKGYGQEEQGQDGPVPFSWCCPLCGCLPRR